MTRVGPDWCLVVPVKRLAEAKTRLAGTAAHRRGPLALAFALDTTEAALWCPLVQSVVAVTDEPDAARALAALGALVVADEPDAGLNPALAHGVAAAVAAHPECGVGSLSADLPALRPHELARALAEAGSHPTSFVRDMPGTGTTLLLARRAADFAPSFGHGSAERHERSGAVDVTVDGLDSLRRDVDTESDLAAAAALGLGPRTAAVAALLHTPAADG